VRRRVSFDVSKSSQIVYNDLTDFTLPALHPRFSFKNVGEVIRPTGFFAGLASSGLKIAINCQKSAKNVKKMLSASKNLDFFAPWVVSGIATCPATIILRHQRQLESRMALGLFFACAAAFERSSKAAARAGEPERPAAFHL